jgi:hypothetical protein
MPPLRSGDFGQVRREVALIAGRDAPQPPAASPSVSKLQQFRNRVLHRRTGRLQRIVIGRQRAKSRDCLDDARRRLRADRRSEAQDTLAEFPVDTVAVLDNERPVAGREETHFHRLPC